jgi:phage regulator Rha-like protein
MSKKKLIGISALVSHEVIERKIYHLRSKKVMFSQDLASLYGVETKALHRAIKRNKERFPDDFMFLLTNKEVTDLRCQFGTSSWGGRRYLPYAFTEHGILMLSSVLNSSRAIQMSVHIIRAFIKQRELINAHKDLRHRVDELEKKYDVQFQVVFKAIRTLLDKNDGNDKEKRW